MFASNRRSADNRQGDTEIKRAVMRPFTPVLEQAPLTGDGIEGERGFASDPQQSDTGQRPGRSPGAATRWWVLRLPRSSNQMLVAACLVLIAATLIMQVLEFRATIGAGSQAAHGAPSTQTQGVSYPALVCYVRPYVVNRVQASPFITLASNSQTQVDTSPALVRSGQSSLQSSATAGTVQAVFRTGQAVSPVGALYCTAPYALHNWTTDQHAAITLARQPARSALAAPLTTSNSLRVQTPVWPGWATPTSA